MIVTFSTFLSKISFHEFTEVLKLGLALLHLLPPCTQAAPGPPWSWSQTLPIRLLELLHEVLISGLHHVHYLKALLLHALHKGRVGNLLFALTSDVTDGLLGLLHVRHIF